MVVNPLQPRFQQLFPRESAEMLAKARLAARNGGQAAYAAAINGYMVDFLRRHVADELAAPDEAIHRVVDGEAMFFATLGHANPHACYRATHGDTSPEVVGLARDAAKDWMNAKLEAIHAGMAHHARTPTPMSQSEASEIWELARGELAEHGWSEDRMMAALDGDLSKTTEDDVCFFNVALDAGLIEAEPAVASRLYANLHIARDQR